MTKKRSFGQIRKAILLSLLSKNSTINSVSTDATINWKTCENHLTYLCGRGLVEEVFSSEYVRMFQLTGEGRLYLHESPGRKNYDPKHVTQLMKKMNSDENIIRSIKEGKKGNENIDVRVGIPSV